MKHAWDLNINLCRVESRILDIQKLTCDGSVLKGYTVNTAKAGENADAVKAALLQAKKSIDAAIQILEEA